MSTSPLVVVEIRTNVFNKSARTEWLIHGKDPDRYRDNLFDPERHRLRAPIFRDMTVPSLLRLCESSIGGRLHVLIHTSQDLPEPFEASLQEAIAPLPRVTVARYTFDEPLDYARTTRETIAAICDGEDETVFASVRLDDDDALAAGYLDGLARYVTPPFVGFNVTFPEGFWLRPDESRVKRGQWVFSAQGLAVINAYNPTTKEFAHRFVSAHDMGLHENVKFILPSVIDRSGRRFIYTVHGQHDGTIRRANEGKKVRWLRLAAGIRNALLFRKRPEFGLPLDADGEFLEQFGHLVDRSVDPPRMRINFDM
jgi:hypothetical protein